MSRLEMRDWDGRALSVHLVSAPLTPLQKRNYLPRALRLYFAQALFRGTGFNGGPPCVPQAQGPSILASVMQEQDLVFRQAQT